MLQAIWWAFGRYLSIYLPIWFTYVYLYTYMVYFNDSYRN